MCVAHRDREVATHPALKPGSQEHHAQPARCRNFAAVVMACACVSAGDLLRTLQPGSTAEAMELEEGEKGA
jgi:hypothetical protein